MQGSIRIDLEKLAKTYGIEDLGIAQILPFSYGRRYTLVLEAMVPREEPVERWLPEEVTG